MPLYASVHELDFRLEELPTRPPGDRVLVADPACFDVLHADNPHMVDASGELKRVDAELARSQWRELVRIYEELGLRVDVLEATDGLPDQVFCANPVLPVPVAPPRAVPARMTHPGRQGEVAPAVAELERQGYAVEAPLRAEGTGDGLWHTGRLLLWAGVGPRSELEAWREVESRYGVHVVVLNLIDPDFYHLDTCLTMLDESACLFVPEAFDERGRTLVRTLFEKPLEANTREARSLLAGNAFCPDGRHVVLQRGCEETCATLRAAGYEPIEVDTGEFLKSGGSVFCMKLFHGPV